MHHQTKFKIVYLAKLYFRKTIQFLLMHIVSKHCNFLSNLRPVLWVLLNWTHPNYSVPLHTGLMWSISTLPHTVKMLNLSPVSPGTNISVRVIRRVIYACIDALQCNAMHCSMYFIGFHNSCNIFRAPWNALMQ